MTECVTRKSGLYAEKKTRVKIKILDWKWGEKGHKIKLFWKYDWKIMEKGHKKEAKN